MQKNKKGFSLIEGLMAIVVFSIGILAVVTLFSQSATQSRSTASRITALGLAQEGVELMRVLRNDDLIQGNGIFDKIDDNPPSKCRIYIGKSDDPQEIGFKCQNNYDETNRLALEIDEDAIKPYYEHGVGGGAVDDDFPVFWRRIYVSNPGGSIPQREIASVVFYREPADTDWPDDRSEVEDECTTQKSCVFAKILLQ